jgi:hypothetical protein
MPYANYADRLARTRAYNHTEHGREVKRAARRREYARHKEQKPAPIDAKPLAQALKNWSTR